MRSVGFSGLMEEAVMPLRSDETLPSTLRFGFVCSTGRDSWASLGVELFFTKNPFMSLNLFLTEMSG